MEAEVPAAAAAGTGYADGTVTLSQRCWRLLEADLQTARSRVVMLRVRAGDRNADGVHAMTREQLDVELSRVDEGLRVALAMVREGHPAHSG